jgi:hypothetical protein
VAVPRWHTSVSPWWWFCPCGDWMKSSVAVCKKQVLELLLSLRVWKLCYIHFCFLGEVVDGHLLPVL